MCGYSCQIEQPQGRARKLCRACVEALVVKRQLLRLLAACPQWKLFRAQVQLARSSTRWMLPCWR